VLDEIHIRKIGTADEIFNSYYTDVLEVAKKKSIKFNIKERPLMPKEIHLDEGDKIIFCIVNDEKKIFDKPIQVAVGSFFHKNTDDWILVDEVLFQENYDVPRATITIPAGKKQVKAGDEIPIGKMGLVVKGIINNGMLHLLWSVSVNEKIRSSFFRNEQNKQAKKQSKVELDFTIPKDDTDNDGQEIDFLNTDDEPELKITLVNSTNEYNKWFNKKFPQKATLNVSPLMEKYVNEIDKFHKYYQ